MKYLWKYSSPPIQKCQNRVIWLFKNREVDMYVRTCTYSVRNVSHLSDYLNLSHLTVTHGQSDLLFGGGSTVESRTHHEIHVITKISSQSRLSVSQIDRRNCLHRTGIIENNRESWNNAATSWCRSLSLPLC